jgi:hypothetical protein
MEHGRITPEQTTSLDALRKEAILRYGESAQFTYYRPSTKTAATLTLEQAVVICGQHIAGESHESVFATLDRMFKLAQKLASEKPAMYTASQRMGHQILKNYDSES